MVFLGNPTSVFAAGCWCLPGPVAACLDATSKPEFSGFAGLGNCAGLGPITNCSCVEKKDCGASGQKSCTITDPAVVTALEGVKSVCLGEIGSFAQTWDVTGISRALCGSSELLNFANKVSLGLGSGGCKNSSLQPFYTKARGTICATSQAEADALSTSGAKWTSLKICEQMSDESKKGECQACASKSGVWTAIGCIETSQEGIVSALVKLGLGVGGGVVLLMILGASFKLSTSKGDPKATDEAKEMITNAIGGLLFIIFAMVLVRTIGIDILKIPGF